MHYKIVISRGNFSHLFSVPIKILIGGLKICNKMNIFLRNTISNLYDVASAPEGSTRDALPEWIQIVFDTAYLLYQKTKQKLSYGQTLKNIVENNAEKEEAKKQQQDDDEQHDMVLKIYLLYKGIPRGVWTKTVRLGEGRGMVKGWYTHFKNNWDKRQLIKQSNL